jgi:hypothetical protein
MKRPPVALIASTVAALAATGCSDGGGVDTPRADRAHAAVTSNDYVASPTLGRGTSVRLFAIPGLGRFGASCTRPGEVRISYRVEAGGTSQIVTTATPRGTGSNTWADPGERVTVSIGPRTGPRVDWQVGLLAEGRIGVLTGSFTVARLAKTFGCFVTGTAHTAKRLR